MQYFTQISMALMSVNRMFTMYTKSAASAHRIEEVLTGGRIMRPAYKSIAKKSVYKPLSER